MLACMGFQAPLKLAKCPQQLTVLEALLRDFVAKVRDSIAKSVGVGYFPSKLTLTKAKNLKKRNKLRFGTRPKFALLDSPY